MIRVAFCSISRNNIGVRRLRTFSRALKLTSWMPYGMICNPGFEDRQRSDVITISDTFAIDVASRTVIGTLI